MKSKFAAALFAATVLASGAEAATYIFTIAPILGADGKPLKVNNFTDGRTFRFTIGETERPNSVPGVNRPTYRMKSYTYTEFGSSTAVTVPGTLGKNIDFFRQIDQGGIALTNSGNRYFRLFNTMLFDEPTWLAARQTNSTAQPEFKLGTFALSTAAWNQTVINPKSRPVDNYTVQIKAFVPEPATWATMIGGFGLVGAAMRRRSATIRFA